LRNAEETKVLSFSNSRGHFEWGGQRPNPISQAMERIIDLCKDSDSFKCLDGVDTCIQIQQDSDGKITFNVF
jgi:hypothetical protein